MEPEFAEGPPEEVERLAAKTLRPERRISAEDLVASELASAILSEPLAKIRHVCEALMLLDEAERKQAGITEDEARESERIYALASAIQNAHIDREMISYSPPIAIDKFATIPWPFPREKAAEWLEWVGEDFRHLVLYYPHGGSESREKRSKKYEELPYLEHLHAITSGEETAMHTYKGLVIRFTQYAMPKAAALMKKIILLVSPDSYRQALQILRGGRRGKAGP